MCAGSCTGSFGFLDLYLLLDTLLVCAFSVLWVEVPRLLREAKVSPCFLSRSGEFLGWGMRRECKQVETWNLNSVFTEYFQAMC